MRKTRWFLWIIAAASGIMTDVFVFAEARKPSYEAGGKRDPFVSLIASMTTESSGLLGVETAEDLTVEGVAYDPKEGSMVIVNGVMLREGEEVGAVRVLEVKSDGARFSVAGVESFKPVREAGSGSE